MKRDMDLIRSILLLIEATPAGQLVSDFSSLSEDEQLIFEHVWLAEQESLLHAQFVRPNQGPASALVSRLTPKGHDFLEQARHDRLWSRAKELASNKGVGLTIDILSKALQALALKAVGLA